MKRSRRRVGCVASLVLGLWGLTAQPARAQADADAAGMLSSAKRVACDFSFVATGSRNKAGAVETSVKPAKLSFRFDTIDVEEATARAIGPFGPSDIIVRLAEGTLHFLQSFREGPLYLTTIFASATPDGKLEAVHTRHEFTAVSLPGFTSRPEQYYGACQILE